MHRKLPALLALILVNSYAAASTFPSGYRAKSPCNDALANALDQSLKLATFDEASVKVKVATIHGIADLMFERVAQILGSGQFDVSKSVLTEAQVAATFHKIKVMASLNPKEVEPYAQELLPLFTRIGQGLLNSKPLKHEGLSDFKAFAGLVLKSGLGKTAQDFVYRSLTYNEIFNATIIEFSRSGKKIEIVREAARALEFAIREDEVIGEAGMSFENAMNLFDLVHGRFEDFSGSDLEEADELMADVLSKLPTDFLNRPEEKPRVKNLIGECDYLLDYTKNEIEELPETIRALTALRAKLAEIHSRAR